MPIRRFPESHLTLGQSLERQRVAYRVRRIALVLSALRERERAACDRGGDAPVALLQSIREFEDDLARLTGRLEEFTAVDDRRPHLGARSAGALL